jgi:hypothetical protein
MSIVYRFKMAYDKVTWTYDEDLDNPRYKSPVACSFGSNCRFDGCCKFVHPGEQGVSRVLIPAHSFETSDGRTIWISSTVKLLDVDNKPAPYYERRRMNMSYSEWKAFHACPTDDELPDLLRKRVMLFTNKHVSSICLILQNSMHRAELNEILYSWKKAMTLIQACLNLISTFPEDMHPKLRV